MCVSCSNIEMDPIPDTISGEIPCGETRAYTRSCDYNNGGTQPSNGTWENRAFSNPDFQYNL